MEETRRMLELNFFALLGMTQLVVPHMRERRDGMIVNVGSIGGKMTLPWLTLYSASKYAVGSLTEGLRMELRRDNVHAMLVCPGYVRTEFSAECDRRAVRRATSGARAGSPSRPSNAPRRSARGVERRRADGNGARARDGCLVALYRLFPGEAQRRMAAMVGTGMNLKLKRTPGIYLVGFMGSGKSTVGRHLAHRMGWNFFDTDHEIESAEKTTIAELFEQRGEPEFRRIESRDPAAARALDRTRPAGRAGAGRRRVRGPGKPRVAGGTTASRSGSIARSKR